MDLENSSLLYLGYLDGSDAPRSPIGGTLEIANLYYWVYPSDNENGPKRRAIVDKRSVMIKKIIGIILGLGGCFFGFHIVRTLIDFPCNDTAIACSISYIVALALPIIILVAAYYLIKS